MVFYNELGLEMGLWSRLRDVIVATSKTLTISLLILSPLVMSSLYFIVEKVDNPYVLIIGTCAVWFLLLIGSFLLMPMTESYMLMSKLTHKVIRWKKYNVKLAELYVEDIQTLEDWVYCETDGKKEFRFYDGSRKKNDLFERKFKGWTHGVALSNNGRDYTISLVNTDA